MPRKRYSKGKSNGWRRGLQTVGQIARTASTALTIAKGVASLINVEFKSFDTDYQGNPDNSGTVTHLSAIAQGDNYNNREGNQCKLKSISVKMTCNQNASATQTFLRCILFMDTEQDGTAPTVAEVLEGTAIWSHKNYLYRKRFIFLKDWVFHFQSTGLETEASSYFKKCDIGMNWTSTTGASSIGNHIYMLVLSTEATNTPSLNYQCRLTYVDN